MNKKEVWELGEDVIIEYIKWNVTIVVAGIIGIGIVVAMIWLFG